MAFMISPNSSSASCLVVLLSEVSFLEVENMPASFHVSCANVVASIGGGERLKSFASSFQSVVFSEGVSGARSKWLPNCFGCIISLEKLIRGKLMVKCELVSSQSTRQR